MDFFHFLKRRESSVIGLSPFYKQVQAHYDLSNEFFALFLDRSMTYSCAYFERENMTLEEAQRAKVDLSLRKCDLRPGFRLLDIGCGWGSTLHRAVTQYHVQGIGLTLSQNQVSEAKSRLSHLGDQVEIRLQGWEEFDEPVDRIVSIGAFEHFRQERYAAFFDKCYRLLPPDGRMLLHSIVWPDQEEFDRLGIILNMDDIQFVKFIQRTIFPGGQMRPASFIRKYAEAAGFQITQIQSLQPHYAKTLDKWAAGLRSAKEKAIELTSEKIFQTYMTYLTGCADYFRKKFVDVVQFTCSKQSGKIG
jgi:cyclopropane-fatty-acyl-phospholipid synthase